MMTRREMQNNSFIIHSLTILRPKNNQYLSYLSFNTTLEIVFKFYLIYPLFCREYTFGYKYRQMCDDPNLKLNK